MADWAGLQRDLLIEIAKRLPSMESYECFGAVCRSWRAAVATKDYLNQTTFDGPWLMHAEKEHGGEDKEKEAVSPDRRQLREFSSFSLGGKIRKVFLPEAINKHCLSCKDWLFTVTEDEIQASLLHPLLRVQIHLPKLDTFPCFYDEFDSYNRHFVKKVILSADPSSTSDFIVMVIWGIRNRLGFCKPGYTSWTPIDEWVSPFFDIVYCNDKFYALDWYSKVVTCDIHGPNPPQLHQIFAPPTSVIATGKYLVECFGKFLIIHRHVDIQEEESYKTHEDVQEEEDVAGEDYKTSYRTREFKIFEVNLKNGIWLEVKDLGNKALFLGHNSSYCIVCSKYNNCKSNSIYFSDDTVDFYGAQEGGGGKDMGIYKLLDGSIQPLFDHDMVCNMVTPPTWVGPSF